MKQYKLFLDDSGTKEYAMTYPQSGGVTPYFLFGGILLPTSESGLLSHRLKALKKLYFGTDNIEIKANWLRRDIERKNRFLEPYKLSEESLTEFTDKVYDLINEADCSLIACIVNKREVQEQYKKPYYAPAIAYDCLLQRAQQEMQYLDGRVHVTIDDMNGATPNKTQYKENLKNQHQRLLRSGSPLWKGIQFDHIDGLSFSNSKFDERLQLADLVAYSVYKQFIDFGKNWEIMTDSLQTYKYFEKISGKFRKDNRGRIQGFGVVKFPLQSRIPWTVDPQGENSPAAVNKG